MIQEDGGIPETVTLLATSNLTGSTASVSFNGFFTSVYKNYQVLASNITLVAGSGTPSIDARFRRDNADVTASDYLVAGVRLYITDGSLGAIGLTGQNHMKISHENTKIIFDTIRDDYFLNIFKNVKVLKNQDKTMHKSKRILCSQFMD